jgi:hypothetical protein
MSKTWSAIPLPNHIVEILWEKRRSLTDSELYNALSKSYGELSYRELNKALMKLEIHGKIHVTWVKKNLRRIELLS